VICTTGSSHLLC